MGLVERTAVYAVGIGLFLFLGRILVGDKALRRNGKPLRCSSLYIVYYSGDHDMEN